MAADLPRSTADLPGSGGHLRSDVSDFAVDEALPYAPSGEGEHLFIRFEKIGVTTPAAVRRLLENVDPKTIGYAGLKDRHAVATQWLSVHDPTGRIEKSVVDVEDIRVLEVARHNRKLKRGHVRSNRFTITLREVPTGGLERAQAIIERLWKSGVPNLFGPQRFGRYGDNAERAARILRGEERPPRRRDEIGIIYSAFQSQIYNDILELRMNRGLLDQALLGDIMQKHATGGLFTVEDKVVDSERAQRLEISATGPLLGAKTMMATEEAKALEDEVLSKVELDERALKRLGPGTRRAMRFVFDPEATLTKVDDTSISIAFSLPSGGYATVVLDEIVKPADARFTRD